MKSVYCPNCGDQFTQKRFAQMYCSRKCRSLYRSKSGRHTTEQQYRSINGNWDRYLARLLIKKDRRRTLSKEFLLNLLKKQNYRCALSGEKLTCDAVRGKKSWTNASLDRIRPGKPYTRGNVQLVCVAVNLWRSDQQVSDFVRWCTKVANHHKRKTMSKRDPKSHRTPEQIKKMDRGYNATPEMKRKRAMNNAARAAMVKKGLVQKGDGKDVDHKKMLKDGGTNSPSNLRVVPKSLNRGWRKRS